MKPETSMLDALAALTAEGLSERRSRPEADRSPAGYQHLDDEWSGGWFARSWALLMNALDSARQEAKPAGAARDPGDRGCPFATFTRQRGEAYLAQATDLADLERRMRELERAAAAELRMW